MADPRPRKKPSRDWYSVSVASLRRLLLLAVAAVVIAGVVFAYRSWERYTLRLRAGEVLEQAGHLAQRIARREDFDRTRSEYQAATEALRHGNEEFAAARFGEALDLGKRALVTLETIDTGGVRGEGPIRFLDLRGSVEFRRGERGAWRRARANDTLHPGDWIRTSADATAEIVFPDRSVFTLRQDSMMYVGETVSDSGRPRSDGPATGLVFGKVSLNSQSGGTVATPVSDVQLDRQTEAQVSFDRAQNSGSYAAYEGGLEVRAAGGATQRVDRLEQVDQRGGTLSAPTAIPGRPILTRPADNFEADLTRDRRLALVWQPVDEATGYALRVARDRLFASLLITDDHRTKSSATLGVRGEGTFYWQVAAVGADGVVGPWSETRTFRVAALAGLSAVEDEEPPEVTDVEVQPYGSLVLVSGRTEPGAELVINGERLSPGSDGTFSKAIQMTQAGWAFVEIEATDGWGNSQSVRKRVFIDSL